MRLTARRPVAKPTYLEWVEARLIESRAFASELASWPTPVDVMRAAWGQIPDQLPAERTPRPRPFHFYPSEIAFLTTSSADTCLTTRSWRL